MTTSTTEPGPSGPADASLARYAEAVRGLLARGGFERSGDPREAKRFRVDHIRDFLAAAGHPERRRTIHIAGSKGKGSVSAMAEAILRHAGAHTLLLTSPDVHQARERVRVDGEPIAYDRFAAHAQRLLADPATTGWSYFELLTVLGWLAGAEAACDWQILEVGLGGRLDTTNVIEAKDVAVITPIDLEHTAILGDTLPEVAAEKAGILTGPAPVVLAPLREPALDVVRARAAEVGAPLHAVAEECALRVATQTLDGQSLDLRTPLRTYRGLKLPLVGRHQAENAAAAVRAVELAWAAAGHGELPEPAVRAGLEAVRWPGRFEAVRRRPLVVLDALHTPLAARRFRETVEALRLPAPRVLVVGLLGGRDFDALARELVAVADTAIVAPPDWQRAAPTEEVAAAFTAAGAAVQRMPGVPQAVDLARSLAGERGSVCVVGSLYSVAEAREHLLGVTGDRALGLR